MKIRVAVFGFIGFLLAASSPRGAHSQARWERGLNGTRERVSVTTGAGRTRVTRDVFHHGQHIGTSITTHMPSGIRRYAYRSRSGALSVARDWTRGSFSYHYEERGGTASPTATAVIEGPFGVRALAQRDSRGAITSQVTPDIRRMLTPAALSSLEARARQILIAPPAAERRLLEHR